MRKKLLLLLLLVLCAGQMQDVQNLRSLSAGVKKLLRLDSSVSYLQSIDYAAKVNLSKLAGLAIEKFLS
ncbi:MAG: hypothetical protein RMM17_06415 [Acidobacteriota bacterium]|nr:hypothetical protein [Blastocatellia bacterium]MDW8412297.1 hypothetical protein [Acidobacteriota bacterium]